MNAWYYAKEQQQHGPISKEQLSDLAASGKLDREDLVWREGMADWKPAHSVPELFPTPPPLPTNDLDGEVSDRKSEPSPSNEAPVVGTIGESEAVPNQKQKRSGKDHQPNLNLSHDGPIGEPLSKKLYLGGLVAFLGIADVLIVISRVAAADGAYDASSAAIELTPFALIPGAVIVARLYYRMWKTIQDGHARTTPGKAVGYLLIPVFNFYWSFQVTWGFAKDYNQLLDRQSLELERLPEGLFLAQAILVLASSLVALIPGIGLALIIASHCVMLAMVAKICDGVNALPGVEKKPKPTQRLPLTDRQIDIISQLRQTMDQRGIAATLDKYRGLKRNHRRDQFDEDLLNEFGYELLDGDATEEAIGIFELNVREYPKASNPHDSLGEAYMIYGEDEKAIDNYQKSLELDPDNRDAVRILKKLKEKNEAV